MHHARHQSRHPHKGKILMRKIGLYPQLSADVGEEESEECAHEESRGKGSAAPATGIGGHCGEDLQ